LHGALRIEELAEWQAQTPGFGADVRSVHLDMADIGAMDTAGAWFVADLRKTLENRQIDVTISGMSPRYSELIETVTAHLPSETPPPTARWTPLVMLTTLGAHVSAGVLIVVELFNFLGLVLLRIAGLMVRPWRIRFTALVHHMQEIGVKAVPIVSLMSFLIGVVIAYQGATQLRQFGAEVFVVDLIAISVLRELGVLLTAIIVAGRSGSAFTAAIGAMKMREEIDALQTLSLDPIEVVVAPRVIALVLVLPILAFISAIMGLVGGALMAWAELGISPGVFQARLVDAVHPNHFLVGMVKAPFFAAIIGIIGCFEGMKVKGDTESLGRLTSRSVVFAIFTVILVDALFSIFFALIDI
jgi:phospholipid/cholesterol/gamma-HCH transport system permease protein